MARRLKVWGGLQKPGRFQIRTIVAAHNAEEAARALGVSLYTLRTWYAVTGNAAELEAALAQPGVVLYAQDTRGLRGAAEYRPKPPAD